MRYNSSDLERVVSNLHARPLAPCVGRATIGLDAKPSSHMKGSGGHQASEALPDRSGSLSNNGGGSTIDHLGNNKRLETGRGDRLGTRDERRPIPTTTRMLDVPHMDSGELVSGANKNQHRLENK